LIVYNRDRTPTKYACPARQRVFDICRHKLMLYCQNLSEVVKKVRILHRRVAGNVENTQNAQKIRRWCRIWAEWRISCRVPWKFHSICRILPNLRKRGWNLSKKASV